MKPHADVFFLINRQYGMRFRTGTDNWRPDNVIRVAR
jgi:hypothetical protein